MISFLIYFMLIFVGFWLQVGGPRGSHEPAFQWLVGSWDQDSPKRPPRAPQEPPKSLQDPSKRALGTDFWSIFDRFWMHFWQMFCGLVVNFWYFLIFVVNVLWACYLSKARWRGWPKATGSGAPEGVLLCGIELLNFLNPQYLSVLTIKTGPQISPDLRLA